MCQVKQPECCRTKASRHHDLRIPNVNVGIGMSNIYVYRYTYICIIYIRYNRIDVARRFVTV